MNSLNKAGKEQTSPSFTDHILTVRDVAAYLRLKPTTVYKLAKSGELPGFKVGDSWRFIESEVERRIVDAQLKVKTHPGRKGAREIVP